MKLNFKRNKAPKLPKKVTRAEYNDLSYDFYELREELATNGVVRDLRKMQREFAEFAEFKKHTVTLVAHHDEQLQSMQTNGVATAINKLNKEVFDTKKDAKSTGLDARSLIAMLSGAEVPQDATLAGKVDAIIAHLGLEVTVEPEKKTVVPAKAVATKVKAPAKKKGRR